MILEIRYMIGLSEYILDCLNGVSIAGLNTLITGIPLCTSKRPEADTAALNWSVS
jgi:hypothetical protein